MSATTLVNERLVYEASVVADAGAVHAIAVDNISKVYPIPFQRLRQGITRKCLYAVEALRDISFNVREGEIFGLIGPNGAGKTTLTKIIATLVQPTTGTVMVRGSDSVFDEDAVRVQVGLASAEERSFYWRLTVKQNLLFFSRLYGMSDKTAKRRIADLLELFHMEEYVDRRFGELSTGNKQRMAVMRALIGNPPVLLLDEPTRSLDPIAAATMRSIIRGLVQQQTPTSIFLTSHNLSEVEELCSRVAILSGGGIRALDTPKALKFVDRPTERVHLRVRGISDELERLLLALPLDDCQLTPEGSDTLLSFTRVENDDRLNLALRMLYDNSVTVLSFDTERTTLLDVIRGYEKDRQQQGGRTKRC
jgi:ABC-2 type transport system ATP-binding protein